MLIKSKETQEKVHKNVSMLRCKGYEKVEDDHHIEMVLKGNDGMIIKSILIIREVH